MPRRRRGLAKGEDKAGGGNYQTLINDALLQHVHGRSTVDIVRQVVREEMASYGAAPAADQRRKKRRAAGG